MENLVNKNSKDEVKIKEISTTKKKLAKIRSLNRKKKRI